MSGRFPTCKARQSLAARFGLPYDSSMQDWEWEVADAARFDEFLAGYRPSELTEYELFSLMEVLVQCAEDMPNEQGFLNAWRAIEPLLRGNIGTHRATIEYWSCLGEHELAACFRVTPSMRRLLSVSALK
jgi:hypothetical protein